MLDYSNADPDSDGEDIFTARFSVRFLTLLTELISNTESNPHDNTENTPSFALFVAFVDCGCTGERRPSCGGACRQNRYTSKNHNTSYEFATGDSPGLARSRVVRQGGWIRQQGYRRHW
jgi:hypothetical protein